MTVIPAAIDALLAACRSAPTLRGVSIYDGPETVEATPAYVAIGLDAEDAPPADATSGIAGLAGPRRRDIATISNLVWASSGNAPVAPVRQRADELFGHVRAVIEADPRLGGAVTFAEIVSYTYRPVRSKRGIAAQIEFRVQVTAIR